MEIINFSEKFLEDIVKVAKQSFLKPWTKEMFLSSARNNSVKFRILAECKMVAGYYITSTTADEMEILDIAVEPAFRRRAFGKAILTDIKKEAANEQVKFIFLEVRQSNIVALNLYKSFGFEEIGIRKKYYGNENALV
ncbi:MAG: ribosomal protein S18-alanine N-acetyltransferase, partial [Endomicrobium sp.]|nr:ribosomal protein S18-alanine N-acetyltransferase [Endomicrobium sp.]